VSLVTLLCVMPITQLVVIKVTINSVTVVTEPAAGRL
jgi:hypothetical protein